MKKFLLSLTVTFTVLGMSYYGYASYDNSHKKIEHNLLAQSPKYLAVKKLDTNVVNFYYEGEKKAVMDMNKEDVFNNLPDVE